MSSLLADAPLTQLIPTLWKCRPASMEEVLIGVHIPHTVIYEHNFPKGLFHTTAEGYLQRRIGKEIDSKTVVDVFSTNAGSGEGKGRARATANGGGGVGGSSPRAKSSSADPDEHDPRKSARTPDGVLDIVAVYVETRNDNSEFAVQFLTDAGLRAFLLGSTAQAKASGSGSINPLGGPARAASPMGGDASGNGTFGDDPATADIRLVQNKNGILQKFIYPIGVRNELIQVIWTSHMCIAEKLRSNSLLGDTAKTPFQRAATFQAPPSYTTRAYVAPHTAEMIRQQCELLVDQIFVVEHKLVEQLTLYFKVDEREKLWLLWCSSIRFTVGPSLPRPATTRFTPSGGRKPAILPEFVLPPSCAGGGARKDASRGAGGGSGGDVYRIASSTSFVAVDEDGALAIELPRMLLRCTTSRPPSGNIALPTQSRLCPKMRWLRGPLRVDRTEMVRAAASRPVSRGEAHNALSCPLVLDETLSQCSLTPANTHRPSQQQQQFTSAGQHSTLSVQPAPQQQQQRHRGSTSSAIANQRSSASDVYAHESSISTSNRPSARQLTPGTAAAARSVTKVPPTVTYTMADFPRIEVKRPPSTIELALGRSALAQTSAALLGDEPLTHGNYAVEMALVLKLTRAPVPPQMPKQSIPKMKDAKRDIELAMELLEAIRDTCYSHFLLFESEPMPFSLPAFAFGTDDVLEKVSAFVAGCGFERVSLAEAVRLDKAISRCGVVDEISHHHRVYDDLLAPAAIVKGHGGGSGGADKEAEVICFSCTEAKQVNSLSARMTPFFVVGLRNLHAEIEAGLMPSGSVDSNATSNTNTPTSDINRRT